MEDSGLLEFDTTLLGDWSLVIQIMYTRKCVNPTVCETWKIVCSQTQVCHMRCI